LHDFRGDYYCCCTSVVGIRRVVGSPLPRCYNVDDSLLLVLPFVALVEWAIHIYQELHLL